MKIEGIGTTTLIIEGLADINCAAEYALSEDEKLKCAGKLQDKTIKLGVREIVPFGGRLHVRGQIMEVDGLK